MSNLRRDIANALGEHDELNITLCVRGGSQGRLTPLVTDLPDDAQTMEIVVFTTGSQGESPCNSFSSLCSNYYLFVFSWKVFT